MINDSLKRLTEYPIHPQISVAKEFILQAIEENYPEGRYPVGDGGFANVESYITADEKECRWEAHRKFLDIQLIVQGEEAADWAPVETLEVDCPYHSENDVEFYHGEKQGTSILRPGLFAVYFPQDAHRPRRRLAESMKVKKIVVKLPVG